MQKTKFTYKTVLDGITFLLLSCALIKSVIPTGFLSLPLFIAVCYNKGKSPYYAVLHFISYLVTGSYVLLIPTAISSFIVALIFSIYSFKSKTVKGEIIIYSILATLPYIFIRGSQNLITVLILAVISLALSLAYIPAVNALMVRRFKYKTDALSWVSLAVLAFLVEIGFIRIFSALALKSVVIFLILFSGYVYKNQLLSVALAVVLGVAPSIMLGDFTSLSTYALLATASSIFIKNSHVISAFFLLALDTVFLIFLKVYGSYTTYDVFYSVIPVAVFLFLPTKALEAVKKTFYSFDEKVLSRYAINRFKNAVSNKLYGVADVFSEMSNCISELKDGVLPHDELLNVIAVEIVTNVCDNCPSRSRCKSRELPNISELKKIISVGVAKSRVSLIDLTKNFTENCGYTNGVIYEMNALITKYKEKIKELDDLSAGKELIKLHVDGVAESLKIMALETAKTVTYNDSLERKLYDCLAKVGIIASEIYVYESGDNQEIDFVLPRDAISGTNFLQAVNQVAQKEMSVTSRTGLSEETVAVTLKPTPLTDAAFGIASAVKDGSTQSGDTHSLIKINEGKFLVALSDGMGSGKRAENTSKTAVSLIESFYKAGLDSSLILNLVNRVLSISSSDNFSAIDVLTVDLFNLTAHFIKIGAPRSFVIADNAVKIIEGSSLPLGILEDLNPIGCNVETPIGAIIVLITDGISDAFSSTTDFIDYLRAVKTLNPQTLADSILNRAIELSGGKKLDDMTALCVRIFKKNQTA